MCIQEHMADMPQKKRKTAAAKGTGDDKTFMKRIFDDVYDMTDDIGQPLNQYFVKPVDKKVSFATTHPIVQVRRVPEC